MFEYQSLSAQVAVRALLLPVGYIASLFEQRDLPITLNHQRVS